MYIIDSNIFVTINYSIQSGALICLQCDLIAKTSELQFIAHGLQLSALILLFQSKIQMFNVNISYRFSSKQTSGIVSEIEQNVLQFQIEQCIITGYNFIYSENNGYLCSYASVDVIIQLNALTVCSDVATKRVGNHLKSFSQSNVEVLKCASVCGTGSVVTYCICKCQSCYLSILQSLENEISYLPLQV
ncbi:Hypothetical_protein [Hexamita inflata]|uniref:Hypothetical_protein n=1 Tax=Hexamita inflata TaxID=28002 RepID=A0AA86QFR3_9EUKA|nr:Hypothetical protein HINF_LOCUS44833 [Hexamita inflata]